MPHKALMIYLSLKIIVALFTVLQLRNFGHRSTAVWKYVLNINFDWSPAMHLSALLDHKCEWPILRITQDMGYE